MYLILNYIVSITLKLLITLHIYILRAAEKYLTSNLISRPAVEIDPDTVDAHGDRALAVPLDLLHLVHLVLEATCQDPKGNKERLEPCVDVDQSVCSERLSFGYLWDYSCVMR